MPPDLMTYTLSVCTDYSNCLVPVALEAVAELVVVSLNWARHVDFQDHHCVEVNFVREVGPAFVPS